MISSPEFAPPIGEVIAANTSQFTAQCIDVPGSDGVSDLPDPPPFGVFVRIGGGPAASPSERDAIPLPADFDPFESPSTAIAPISSGDALVLYGVVFHAEIGSLEAGRPLTAFGLDEESLRREQPQIFELLATRFSAVLVAHATNTDGSGIRPHLPPHPPRPHARVYIATESETRHLTERLDYLRPLLLGLNGGATSYPADELVAALLRNAWRAHNGDDAFLLRAGRELASLLPTDYDRLRSIVNRVIR
ncbi:MAG: hypothetical protein V4671_05455 [Armatimonadota bacterium]